MDEVFKMEVRKVGDRCQTKFSNLTKDYDVFIGYMPKRPKRKVRDLYVVSSETFKFFEEEFDLDRLNFHFQKVNRNGLGLDDCR